jgi:hypothetical protein
MRSADRKLDDIGAEALPGGLREINAISRPGLPEPVPGAKPPARTPLVGLIDLLAVWLGRADR